jgi:hypothetical protein
MLPYIASNLHTQLQHQEILLEGCKLKKKKKNKSTNYSPLRKYISFSAIVFSVSKNTMADLGAFAGIHLKDAIVFFQVYLIKLPQDPIFLTTPALPSFPISQLSVPLPS